MSSNTTIHLAGLTPREAVADVIYRVTAAFDLADAALLESGLTEDAVIAIDARRFTGRAAFRADCWGPVSRLDTTHMASNVRVRFPNENDEDDNDNDATKATATATFTANHFRAGEGANPAAAGFTTGGTYTLECVRDEDDAGLWKARSWVVQVLWCVGDPTVMQSGAAEVK